MQFITNGPDIPDALLQAHEEGRVVFFCGAGISYPAGLPGFEVLVEKIYHESGAIFSDIEKETFKHGRFDATLDLLERRLPGQRLEVRHALVKALQPKLRRKGATDTQAALLRLARNRKGALRLVTTNFDRTFHVAAKRTKQTFQTHVAPMLPIPKDSRWDGLVYLHGQLPEKNDDAALNRLIVTSGDFGLAYLTERWAARFVSELFRNYVVCFVGYSINDVVLRYMMDALAADRMLGEVAPQAWALGDCEPGQEKLKTIEWEAKGVKPILYTLHGSSDHAALHQTLHTWADTYRDGIQGKEAIVVKHALARPQASTQQDDFVGRMLWALSDKSGLPAKCFADFNPVPPLDWLLESFTHARFKYGDLPRFGVSPRDEVDTKLRFSLVRRPAPYDHAPVMRLVLNSVSDSRWDNVMPQLARWLTRHLNDPRLVIWIAEHGGQLHDGWSWLIERELDRFAKLEHEGNTSELDKIRSQAPMAIPGKLMKTLWRLLLSNRVKSPKYDDWQKTNLYEWQRRLKCDGLTTTLRLELHEVLAPKVALKKPFYLRDDDPNSDDEATHTKPTDTQQLVNWKLVLATDHVYSALPKMTDDPHWIAALPRLLEDFQQLLRDALDLLRELGEADDQSGKWSDQLIWSLPSITPHWQNRRYRDWVSLIELLRDAWLVLHEKDHVRSTHIAEAWFAWSYPTFKRLALFAASQDNCIQPEQWVGWLLLDNTRWLWSSDTKREVCRLFVLKGKLLHGTAQKRLEAAILSGPPCERHRDGLVLERWQDLATHSIWLRLAKLKSSGLTLGKTAATRLAEIQNAEPDLQLKPNESDEFSFWISGTGDPDYEERRTVEITPRKRKELVQWLKKPVPEMFYEDTWNDVCRDRFFHSLGALCDLAQSGEWPTERWRWALQVWSEGSLISRAWRYTAPLVQTMPDAVIQETTHSITSWLKTASRKIDRHEDILLNLCSRILALDINADTEMTCNDQSPDQPVADAINHPIGHITQALINLCFRQNPNDNDLLPEDIKPLFTALVDVRVSRFRHGRVILGSHLIALFRVDRKWTQEYLLPLFSWDNPAEAKAVWEGFLWSSRLYQPLLLAIKPQLLDSANHYAELGGRRQQFATFLTYAALDLIEGYTIEEFRSAIDVLPQEGLEQCAQGLSQALEGAGEQREDYWKNRVHPFWKKIWPKYRDRATPQIAESLACLVIAARDEFPAALATVYNWLQPIEHPYHVMDILQESKLCKRFPQDALQLLNALINDQRLVYQEVHQELGLCLEEIVQAKPELKQDASYLRLHEYAQ